MPAGYAEGRNIVFDSLAPAHFGLSAWPIYVARTPCGSIHDPAFLVSKLPLLPIIHGGPPKPPILALGNEARPCRSCKRLRIGLRFHPVDASILSSNEAIEACHHVDRYSGISVCHRLALPSDEKTNRG